jgi:Uncharacterised protein conserved in bacteria (DUF2336)
VLSQGQIDLFDLAFAKLLEIELSAFRRFFYQQRVGPVALACRAVGIDRSVFATVFNLSRQTRDKAQSMAPEELTEADAVFASFTKAAALGEIHVLAQAV